MELPKRVPSTFSERAEGQGGGFSGFKAPKVDSIPKTIELPSFQYVALRYPMSGLGMSPGILRSPDKSGRSFEPEIPLPVPPPFSEKGGGDVIGKPELDSKLLIYRKTVSHCR